MANPNPQHTPTDGLGVAAYVTLSGSNGSSVITNSSGGSNKSNGNNGQGIGPGTAASGAFPVAQYALTLSVSAAGGYASSLAVTAALKDVSNSAYTPVGNIVAKSYNNPSAGSPSWYRPSNFAGYSADVASVAEASVSAGNEVFTITALNPGQAIVECAFPTFDNTLGNQASGQMNPSPEQLNPLMAIYVQVVVTVIP
jgi:hypothetical protein